VPYENTDFFRVTAEGATRIPSTALPKRIRRTILLAPLKSVAISPFAFPFHSVVRIREALKLQTLPYAAAGKMDLFPSILEKTSRSSSGVVWFVSGENIEEINAPLSNVENKIWPAPLPLVSRIHGDGLTLWVDEANICSMLWRGGVPVLYRWKAAARTSPSAERAWLEAYCASRSEEPGEFFMMNAAQPSELALLPEIIKESLVRCPWLEDVNLSRSALDSAIVLEDAVRLGTRAAIWVLGLGLLVAAGNGLRYYEYRQNIDALRERSAALYREAFDPSAAGRISDPLGLARSKIVELRGNGPVEGRLISEVFSDLGEIFEKNPSMDVTLDSLRYNPDGVDYTGSAPDTGTIQTFRGACAENAASAQLLNLQNAPGIGFRFDLSVRW
jgi:hypothetical protein